jgi:sialic acid synthase SpsE
MATPFDETSVGWCEDFDLDVIKLASSDVNDWPLIERIAETRKPVIASSGGASEVDLDNLVLFFENRNIPLAINHCVSLYPTEDEDLQLNEIDYLRDRYPHHVIGLSTHEYRDWQASMFISYAKGARTWERHIDMEDGTHSVSPYCSLPSDIDIWLCAYHTARTMCGTNTMVRRNIKQEETHYLEKLLRGIYAKRDLPIGHRIDHKSFTDDFYLAIPLQPKQTSVRDIVTGLVINRAIEANEPLMAADIDSPIEREYVAVGATSQNDRSKPQ